MRRLLILASLLAFALPAEAGPLSFVKRQVRDHPLRTQLVFAGVASGIGGYGLHVARVQNVENATAHYGAAWPTFGAGVGLNLVGVFVGHKLGGKTGDTIAYGSSFLQLGYGAWEWHGGLNKPSEEKWNETHIDLSRVVLLRH